MQQYLATIIIPTSGRGLVDITERVQDVNGRWGRLPGLIAQLLHPEPDVLVAIGGVAALSARLRPRQRRHHL